MIITGGGGFIEYKSIRLSVCIMADQRRVEKYLNPLLVRLNNDIITVIIDTEQSGAWNTARTAWETRSPDATHHLVLQEDVSVCQHLLPTLAHLCYLVRDYPISPYANNKAIEQARDQGSSWALIQNGVWGQGVILPVRFIDQMIVWCDNKISQEYRKYDTRVAHFLSEKHWPNYCTAPSLIDHLGWQESMLGHHGKEFYRKARWYIGDDTDPTVIDWTAGLKSMPFAKAGITKIKEQYWLNG